MSTKGARAQDLRALGLGDAAGDRDDHAPAAPLLGGLQAAQAAELGKHLLRRLLADVAGVEDHHVGVLRASIGGA